MALAEVHRFLAVGIDSEFYSRNTVCIAEEVRNRVDMKRGFSTSGNITGLEEWWSFPCFLLSGNTKILKDLIFIVHFKTDGRKCAEKERDEKGGFSFYSERNSLRLKGPGESGIQQGCIFVCFFFVIFSFAVMAVSFTERLLVLMI